MPHDLLDAPLEIEVDMDAHVWLVKVQNKVERVVPRIGVGAACGLDEGSSGLDVCNYDNRGCPASERKSVGQSK